jgi:hypothetical protein
MGMMLIRKQRRSLRRIRSRFRVTFDLDVGLEVCLSCFIL